MNGRLALGITSSNAFHPQIFALLRQFQLRYPAVTLRQVEGRNMAALMSALGKGSWISPCAPAVRKQQSV